MRLRFLAAAGPAAALRRLAARLARDPRSRLVETHCSECLSIWTEPDTPLLESDCRTAAAVGLMFERSSATALRRLPKSPAILQSVLRDHWGSYVLFTADGGAHSVLRDPSGSIPLYYGAGADLQLYASDAGMLGLAWPGRFRPDLRAAGHWLTFPALRTARTGAAGVTELLPGTLREVSPDGAGVRTAWSPQRCCAPHLAISSLEEATSLLRQEILRCVPRLVDGRPNIVLQLSGGLDSSIVAAALAASGIDFRAITFATRSADGDERRYARLVASHFGIDLLELGEAGLDLAVRMPTSPFQRPPSPFLQALRSAQAVAAGSAGLVLDGGGGDNIFASINSAAPAIDAFRRGGVSLGLAALRDLAGRHGCTMWAAAASAVRRARRGAMIRWPADRTFLQPSGEFDRPDAHPWLAGTKGMLPGSADHLRLLAGVHHFLVDPARDEPTNLHPLICQPVLELCLRIPSWLWVAGGRDRAVARTAFRTILPDAILDRRGKGSLQSLFVRGFQSHRSLLRGLLVGGRLAREGIVDSDAVATYLDEQGEPRDVRYIRILELASAEQWLRSFG